MNQRLSMADSRARLRVLLVACCLFPGWNVAHAQTWQALGKLTAEAFSGSVLLAETEAGLLIDVGAVLPSTPGQTIRAVPSEAVGVWVLLENSSVAELLAKDPSKGQPLFTCTGGCQPHLLFTFDKSAKPIAVVVAVMDHIQVFPIPGSGFSRGPGKVQ